MEYKEGALELFGHFAEISEVSYIFITYIFKNYNNKKIIYDRV